MAARGHAAHLRRRGGSRGRGDGGLLAPAQSRAKGARNRARHQAETAHSRACSADQAARQRANSTALEKEEEAREGRRDWRQQAARGARRAATLTVRRGCMSGGGGSSGAGGAAAAALAEAAHAAGCAHSGGSPGGGGDSAGAGGMDVTSGCATRELLAAAGERRERSVVLPLAERGDAARVPASDGTVVTSASGTPTLPTRRLLLPLPLPAEPPSLSAPDILRAWGGGRPAGRWSRAGGVRAARACMARCRAARTHPGARLRAAGADAGRQPAGVEGRGRGGVGGAPCPGARARAASNRARQSSSVRRGSEGSQAAQHAVAPACAVRRAAGGGGESAGGRRDGQGGGGAPVGRRRAHTHRLRARGSQPRCGRLLRGQLRGAGAGGSGRGVRRGGGGAGGGGGVSRCDRRPRIKGARARGREASGARARG